MRFILILVMFLFSCGQMKPSYGKHVDKDFSRNYCKQMPIITDPLVTPYVQEFYAEAIKRKVKCRKVNSVSLTTEDLTLEDDKGVIGITWASEESIDIVMERWVFTDASDQYRRSLVYHEESHGSLGLGHSDPDVISIMNPMILEDDIARTNWDYLVFKLFNRDLSP